MVATSDRLLTFEDYLNYQTDDAASDVRYEFVDGELIPMNPPRIEHFLIAKFLTHYFEQAIQQTDLPWMVFAEIGVRTGFRRSRVVDLCVVQREQVQELAGRSAVFETPPLLVVEIVSLDSIGRDYRYKRSEYAAAGIPEYWIVDPLENCLTILQLQEGFYDVIPQDQSGLIQSPILSTISQQSADQQPVITIEQIWQTANLAPDPV
jgi:Uma2 family endonuclease